MLGLPSTTEVGRRIPKEAFYGHLKVGPALRQSFVDDVERFTVANSVKTATTGIASGERVDEVLVLEVALKAHRVPEDVLACVANANPHKLLFVCTYGTEACMAVMLKSLVVGAWQDASALRLDVNATDMDEVWDSLASQIAYGDCGNESETVEERFEADARLDALHAELAKVEARGRKERQFARKNALFEQAKELKRQIVDIENGR